MLKLNFKLHYKRTTVTYITEITKIIEVQTMILSNACPMDVNLHKNLSDMWATIL